MLDGFGNAIGGIAMWFFTGSLPALLVWSIFFTANFYRCLNSDNWRHSQYVYYRSKRYGDIIRYRIFRL